jgi:CRP/FNR family cyclic AMP-dependent transcriptional regulator
MVWQGLQWTGYVAAALVFATFYMRTMQPLRLMAISSNVVFLIYAVPLHLWPIAILHALLLPLNGLRLIQLRRMLGHLEQARSQDLDVHKLLPHLAHEDRAAGVVLFRRGDRGDGAYYIVSGAVEIPELGIRRQAGEFFGEVGAFSSARLRTASAVCAVPTRLYRIGHHELALAFHRDPALAFGLMRLIADRMAENVTRAADTIAEAQPTA